MKKNIKIMFVLVFLLMTGCSKNNSKTNELKDIGLNKNQIENFIVYSDEVSQLFDKLNEMNDQEDFSGDNINEVKGLLDDIKVQYANNSADSIEEFTEYIYDYNKNSNPVNYSKYCSTENRTITSSEAAMTYDMFKHFTENIADSFKLDTPQKEKMIKWFNKNNKYDGVFEEAYLSRENLD